MATKLPADLSDTAALPDIHVTSREAFDLQWGDYCAADGSRNVLVVRYTLGARYSWGAMVVAGPSERLASIVRRAAEVRSAA